MSMEAFQKLSPRQRALVTVSVLLDGREAPSYLLSDAVNGIALSEGAEKLSQHSPELRMPLVGTLLRMALEEMRR